MRVGKFLAISERLNDSGTKGEMYDTLIKTKNLLAQRLGSK